MPDLDDGDADPDAPQDVGDDGEILDPLAEPERMDRDAFWIVFRTAFDLPQYIMPDLEPLAIAPQEESRARGAADACYSLLEIYYPAALMPQGETFAHLMVAGPFFIAKAMVIKAVIESRRQPPPRPVQQQQRPANDNAQPQPQQQQGHPETGEWKLPGQAA
jgi:hypothetical protein